MSVENFKFSLQTVPSLCWLSKLIFHIYFLCTRQLDPDQIQTCFRVGSESRGKLNGDQAYLDLNPRNGYKQTRVMSSYHLYEQKMSRQHLSRIPCQQVQLLGTTLVGTVTLPTRIRSRFSFKVNGTTPGATRVCAVPHQQELRNGAERAKFSMLRCQVSSFDH